MLPGNKGRVSGKFQAARYQTGRKIPELSFEYSYWLTINDYPLQMDILCLFC